MVERQDPNVFNRVSQTYSLRKFRSNQETISSAIGKTLVSLWFYADDEMFSVGSLVLPKLVNVIG